jgi:hypothetical protein
MVDMLVWLHVKYLQNRTLLKAHTLAARLVFNLHSAVVLLLSKESWPLSMRKRFLHINIVFHLQEMVLLIREPQNAYDRLAIRSVQNYLGSPDATRLGNP